MNWKIIWQSLNHKDMRKRILAVLGIIVVFRILAIVPVPLGNSSNLHQVLSNLFTSKNAPQLLGFLNALSGGALANFSIMLAGLGPYINASIIMQLLTKAIPKLEALHNEGEFGQKKINQYTRILTLPLAIVQSIGSIFLLRTAAQSLGGNISTNASAMEWVITVAAMTGGSMLLMWLGELVTEQSIGNGISLIITVGIVSRLPSTIYQLVNSALGTKDRWRIFNHVIPMDKKAFIYLMSIIFITVFLTWIVVKLNEAARNLTVNYAKRVQGNRAYGGVTTTLPVKLITAGVVPIIFAVAFLSVPSFAGELMRGAKNNTIAGIGNNLYTWFQPPSSTTFSTLHWQAYIYPVTYFLLVFVFTFFYTSITFNSKEIAENLQKQGGFLEGVRSGKQTEKYLSRIVNRLTLFGAFSLGILALLPIIGQIYINQNITIGGTSILILVSVSLQTLRAVESRALMITYDQYSQPDFFYEPEIAVEAATGARRLKFLPPAKRKNKPKSS